MGPKKVKTGAAFRKILVQQDKHRNWTDIETETYATLNFGTELQPSSFLLAKGPFINMFVCLFVCFYKSIFEFYLSRKSKGAYLGYSVLHL